MMAIGIFFCRGDWPLAFAAVASGGLVATAEDGAPSVTRSESNNFPESGGCRVFSNVQFLAGGGMSNWSLLKSLGACSERNGKVQYVKKVYLYFAAPKNIRTALPIVFSVISTAPDFKSLSDCSETSR